MKRLQISVGEKFSRLTVREIKSNGSRWTALCSCDCGQSVTATFTHLKNGNTRSCGCLRRETSAARLTTHGACKAGKRAPEYLTWTNIIGRCEDKSGTGWEDYGGRGIKMCPKWRARFETFLVDMGPRPSPTHSIERKNNDGNYEKENCVWATDDVQNNNRRSIIRVNIDGVEMSLKQATRARGLKYMTVYHRIKTLGWSIERAMA